MPETLKSSKSQLVLTLNRRDRFKTHVYENMFMLALKFQVGLLRCGICGLFCGLGARETQNDVYIISLFFKK